jgi:hypothetical protein
VTTVHDLVPLRFPRLVPWRHRWAVRALLGGALRRATRIIAVSDATRAELVARYHASAGKIQVVPGCRSAFAPPSAGDDAVRARRGFEDFASVGCWSRRRTCRPCPAVARVRAGGAGRAHCPAARPAGAPAASA